LKSGRAEGDDYSWADERKLPEKELLAGSYLVALRRAIARRATLHDVADVDLFAFETDCRDYLIKQLTRATHEGASRRIFISARPFTYEDKLSVRVALSKNYVCAVLVKLAANALADIFAYCFERKILRLDDRDLSALRARLVIGRYVAE
jgi:hypothetical protein